MREYMELGASPSSENCIQLDPDSDYLPLMRDELNRYKTMLQSRFPIPEDVRAWFGVKFFSHDFGTYGEVVINWYDEDEKSADFAYHVEAHLPDLWNDDEVILYAPEVV
jgi:hypothetical protein